MKGGQMELFVKHFSELSAQELFEIYKLRVSVFVVEQKCYYQEVDDADKVAYHVWLRASARRLHADTITIEAQTYARKLYENFGFRQTSEEFLEDGIPHIQMQLVITE